MNLIEAIKSGKRFRRKSWTLRDWILSSQDRLDLPIEAILADDWETEELKAAITREQFDEAWNAVWSTVLTQGLLNPAKLSELLAKELGL